MRQIDISFIIPVYNCSKYIQDCVKSIYKCSKYSIELLQLCSITDCEYGKTETPFCISDEAFEIAKKKIGEEKAKSMDFLENALGKVVNDC